MNVFVLSAGRTASSAFSAACKHITNYSSAHESRTGVLGAEKLKYPDDHIEIDNRLTWFTHQLNNKYGNNARYVYLKRDRQKVAESYLKRWNLDESIVRAFGHGVLMMPNIKRSQRLQICFDYVDFVDQNITTFISNKENVIQIQSEFLTSEFTKFWDFVEAEGDLVEAVSTLSLKHNLNRTSIFSRIKNSL